MTLPLTTDTLAAAYDYLRTTPPFSKWNLPESEDVAFRVTRSRDDMGCYWWREGHHIDVSARLVKSSIGLLGVMAHEMTHCFQCCAGMPVTHGTAFDKLAAKARRVHGMDV